MTTQQAQRVRFHGGDPLALTKRIQARRDANAELDRVFGGEEGISPIRFRDPPIVTSWKEALSILWQAGLLIVLFVGIAWTGPIFAEAMGLGR